MWPKEAKHFAFVIVWPSRCVSESQTPYHFIAHKWKWACFVRLMFNAQCLGPRSCRAQPLTIQGLVQSDRLSSISAFPSNMQYEFLLPSPLCLPVVLIYFWAFPKFAFQRKNRYFCLLPVSQNCALPNQLWFACGINVGQMQTVYSANRLASSLLRSFPKCLSDLGPKGS